ncbi:MULTISPECIES: hypothetical protein [Paenibacillus]|uniref:Uncharacterized protein n=1 Tax=Paenibacillus vandeheii TaxID=3035917 RepID=A0ABT8JFL5_9BACL|nr:MULTISPECIES: hypothetical protein [Paenibacillus]MDN4603894.1 hypothetical protein [Paenibacillus vandeheii]
MFTWEEIYLGEKVLQQSLENRNKLKDPRREKVKDFRKGIKSVHYNKESKADRKHDYQQYRTKMKRLMRSEQYELLHNYKRTSGWLTW